MAIYRGPGGAGDATVDATNAAAEVALKTQEAVDAANAAAASAAEAAASAVIASDGLDGIAAYAAAASGSAADALASETNAADSEANASISETNAAASAAAAALSEDNAAISEANANEDAGTATTKAAEAADSADEAAASAAAALISQNSAASSALDAANSAAAAEGYLPSFTGNNGKYLKTNGTSASWETVDALPAQTGNSGKYLTTNGTVPSWVDLNVDPATPLVDGIVYGQTDSTEASWSGTITNNANYFYFADYGNYNISFSASSAVGVAAAAGNVVVGQGITINDGTTTRDFGVITGITIADPTYITTSLQPYGNPLIDTRYCATMVLTGTNGGNVGLGRNVFDSLNDGDNNTVIGQNAGGSIVDGSNNIVIGYNADTSSSSASNEVTIGNTSITKTRLRGAILVGNSTPSAGTSGQVLTSNGASSEPSWTTLSSGTVTSVALSAPTGLTVTGSPVTTSGTLALSYTAGYSIPTDTKQTNWDTAYGWGNHASAGYLTSATAASTYAPLTGTGTSGTWGISITGNAATVTNGLYSTGSYSNPTWLTSVSGSIVSGNISGNAANVTGTVAIANGGTGQATQQAAINALTGTQSAGTYLRSDGTNASLSTIQAADVPTLNQNTTGTAANITATSNSTLTTLSALSLPGSQVSGNISGNAANVTGTVAIANGGSGQTTAQAAMNAFAGAVTSGSYLRGNGTNVIMSTIQAADVPTLNQNTTGTAANVTGTVAVANGGTGSTTLTANNVLLGNGTSALQVVAPGTNGNVLTSNGTTWVSSAPSGGGSAATPTALGTVYGKMTTSGASPSLTALGYNAAPSATGINNTAVGHRALITTTTGASNTAIGKDALYNNLGGSGNTAVGYNPLDANTSGSQNTAMGYQALKSNTTASNNTAVGYLALYTNSTGANNTAVGYQSLYNQTAPATGRNVAVGYQSALSLTTGDRNTALGTFAMNSFTTGNNNTAVGEQALYGAASATGSDNVAVGKGAAPAISSGANNVAVGSNALYSNTTGDGNTAVGYQALYSANRTADVSAQNTAVGSTSGYSLTTGQRNTFIGSNAGAGGFGAGAITTGTYNISIGFATGASATGRNNSIVIGTPYAVVDKGENTGFINPNGGGVYQGNNSSSWSTTSDRRLKKNIVDNNVGLDKLVQIQVRNFEYRLPEEVEDLETHCAIKKEGVQLGVIAQELQQVLPDCVKQESTGVLSVDPDNLTWYTINAIKQLKAELDAAKAEIAALKGQA